MHNRKFSLFKGLMVLLAASLLTACAKNSNSSSMNEMGKSKKNTVPTSACVGNAYLQKYGCSMQRINQAAQSGDPDAQYALGYMYYYGIGTVRDKQTAQLWINRSAEQGQPLAKKAQELIASGGSFHHLHRQQVSDGVAHTGSDSTASSNMGDGQDAARSANTKRYAPTPNVRELNASNPDKPLNEVLPNYGGNQQPSEKPKTVIKSLQKKSDEGETAKDSNPGKVEPITLRNSHTSPVAVTAAARNAITAVEAQMMEIPKRHYTLQLMGGRNLGAIKAFIRQHNLEGKAQYYSAELNHEKWYMLIYGDFPTAIRAHAAVGDLPSELRQLHPWVKSYRIVHDEIRLRRIVS